MIRGFVSATIGDSVLRQPGRRTMSGRLWSLAREPVTVTFDPASPQTNRLGAQPWAALTDPEPACGKSTYAAAPPVRRTVSQHGGSAGRTRQALTS